MFLGLTRLASFVDDGFGPSSSVLCPSERARPSTMRLSAAAATKRSTTQNAWNIRAEHLAPEPKIQQWTVRDESSVKDALEYLRILIGQFVIPKVKGMQFGRDLLRIWTDDASLWYPDLKAKSVLLAAQGNGVELERTLRRLKKEFGSGVVAEGVARHIAALHRAFPEIMERVHL